MIEAKNITLPYTGTSDLERYRRVKVSSNQPAYAGATEEDIGVLPNRVLGYSGSGAIPLGYGTGATVIPKTESGVTLMVASGAITAWADVYGAANGKVSATVNGNYIGKATVAATADGDIIGVLRLPATVSEEAVEAHTADDTLTTAESGTTHTNTGASGTITLTLPAATLGLNYTAHVGAAQQLRLDPNGSETIGLPSTGVQGAAGKYLVADAVGEWVKLKCVIAGTWTPEGYAGTWTAEA